MARPKKTAAKAAAKLEPKSIAFRVSGEYALWVDAIASANQSNVSTLLAQALAEYAKAIGITEGPPART
jgi:hypothetical protein